MNEGNCCGGFETDRWHREREDVKHEDVKREEQSERTSSMFHAHANAQLTPVTAQLLRRAGIDAKLAQV
jgi:hypothetical protein